MEDFPMVYVGIDVSKDKHDCHILTSDGEVLCDNFSFPNSMEGFNAFLNLVTDCCKGDFSNLKVGLEATGHYSKNLLLFLYKSKLFVVVFNPLSVNQSRKANSLRKTKSDKNDARFIAEMLFNNKSCSYQDQSSDISALKSLTRARYRLIKEIQPLKNRYRRSVQLLFPELSAIFCSLYLNTVFTLLKVLPSAKDIAQCNILKLSNILSNSSNGKLKRDKAEALKSAAVNSIGSYNIGDAIELKFTIERIEFLKTQESELETDIRTIMLKINSPITTIPGIGFILGAVILAEIGDISKFSSPSKLLAFAGCEPSTYQSGKFTAANTPMVKHGSKYLRNALYLATSMAYLHSPSFRAYIDLKRSQGKHYYIAVSHGMKKMSRVIFSILTADKPFVEVI
jgi:transposase